MIPLPQHFIKLKYYTIHKTVNRNSLECVLQVDPRGTMVKYPHLALVLYSANQLLWGFQLLEMCSKNIK